MNFDDKIKELEIKLPEAKAPVGSYVATKIVGKLLYISGQISMNASGELIKGKVGKDLFTVTGDPRYGLGVGARYRFDPIQFKSLLIQIVCLLPKSHFLPICFVVN